MIKRIVPLLLVNNGELIKTVRFDSPTYIGDPLNAIRIFNELEVDEICILDKSAREQGIPFGLLREIVTEAFVPVAYGGGVTTVQEIRSLLNLGVEKVVVCSELFNLDFLSAATQAFGSSSIVACIDYKMIAGQRYVFTHGGSRHSSLKVSEVIARAVQAKVGEIMLQCVDRDGTYQGYDLSLLAEVGAAIDNPITIVGGCSGVSDMKKALDCGASACGAGSLFVYYTATRGILINYPDLADFQSAGIAR